MQVSSLDLKRKVSISNLVESSYRDRLQKIIFEQNEDILFLKFLGLPEALSRTIEGIVNSLRHQDEDEDSLFFLSLKDEASYLLIISKDNLEQLLCIIDNFNDSKIRLLHQKLFVVNERIGKRDMLWSCGNKHLNLSNRPYVMGVLNVTPDSFYDGGFYLEENDACRQVEKMIENGADIIDIGGVSTRPSSEVASQEDEIKRIWPIIKRIRSTFPEVFLSVDTFRLDVMTMAYEEGCDIINNVFASLNDVEIAKFIAKTKLGYILCHSQSDTNYNNLVNDINSSLQTSQDILLINGVEIKQICIDVNYGLPYGKDAKQQYEMLRNMEVFSRENSLPLLIGVSRKSFLSYYRTCEVEDRLIPSISAGVIASTLGVNILRVHDVKETKIALNVVEDVFCL